MVTDPSFYQRAQAAGEAPDMSKGASGYFSAPDSGLDPHLFDGDHLRPDVRSLVALELGTWFSAHDVKRSSTWLHVWILGSGITYQWAANRGNGDLDVEFGIDMPKFREYNPDLAEAYPDEAAFNDAVNTEIRHSLWMQNQARVINGQSYEVTFYWNPAVGSDITVINPYAAYSVTDDQWVVRPPELPAGDLHKQYSVEWYKIADRDAGLTRLLSSEYRWHMGTLAKEPPGSPRWHAAGASLNHLVQESQSLLNEIHTGRREAFQGSGAGYGDWYNFRWQRAKETGTIQALHAIAKVGEQATLDQQSAQFGAPVISAAQAMRDAIAVHRPGLR